MGFAEKTGVSEVLEVTDPFFGKSFSFGKKGLGQPGEGLGKIDESEGAKSLLLSFLHQFGVVHVGGKILLSRILQGVGRATVFTKGDQGSRRT